jgi:hypothetical protein
MAKNNEILAELEALEELHGIVRPEDVVEFARDPSTALHERFEWDDTEAARQHRLWQAREILHVTVRYVGDVEKRPVRAFVSLGSDRLKGGGYRGTLRVLDDDQMRMELLLQAKREARQWADRYREFAELAKIREAILEAVAV